MRALPLDRRTMRTAVLVLAALGAAVWIDLTVLGSGRPGHSAAPATAPGQLVVDVTVPGSPAIAGTTDAAPAVATAAGIDLPAPSGGVGDGGLAGTSAATGAAPQPASGPIPQSSFTPTAPPRSSATTAPPASSPSAPVATTTSRPAPTTAPTTQPAPASTFQTAGYQGVGDVVVAITDGQIEFWSCTPASGWGYRVEKNGPSKVEVKFRRTSGEGEAKIEVTLRSDGSLSIKRED